MLFPLSIVGYSSLLFQILPKLQVTPVLHEAVPYYSVPHY